MVCFQAPVWYLINDTFHTAWTKYSLYGCEVSGTFRLAESLTVWSWFWIQGHLLRYSQLVSNVLDISPSSGLTEGYFQMIYCRRALMTFLLSPRWWFWYQPSNQVILQFLLCQCSQNTCRRNLGDVLFWWFDCQIHFLATFSHDLLNLLLFAFCFLLLSGWNSFHPDNLPERGIPSTGLFIT